LVLGLPGAEATGLKEQSPLKGLTTRPSAFSALCSLSAVTVGAYCIRLLPREAQDGPPYNHGSASVQYLGPVSLQDLAGVTIPIDTSRDYVLQPLSTMAETDPSLAGALQQFSQAAKGQQASWEQAYGGALAKATASGGRVV